MALGFKGVIADLFAILSVELYFHLFANLVFTTGILPVKGQNGR